MERIPYDGQRGLFDPSSDEAKVPIHIIGVGAYGSLLAETLARMGYPSLTVQDFDVVEMKNVPVQRFSKEDAGKSKVQSMSDIIDKVADVSITVINEKFEKNSPLQGRIVVSSVDSMAVRKMIWDKAKSDMSVQLFIDFRAGEDNAEFYMVPPNDTKSVKSYEKALFPDSEMASSACTLKGVAYTPLISVGLMTDHLCSFLKGSNVPFNTYYHGQTKKIIESGA